MNRFTLDVGITLSSHFGNMEEWTEVNETLKKAVGRESDSAGTGFGVRDSQFTFDTEEEATAAEKRVQDAFGERLEYSSVYDEDEEFPNE